MPQKKYVTPPRAVAVQDTATEKVNVRSGKAMRVSKTKSSHNRGSAMVFIHPNIPGCLVRYRARGRSTPQWRNRERESRAKAPASTRVRGSSSAPTQTMNVPSDTDNMGMRSTKANTEMKNPGST